MENTPVLIRFLLDNSGSMQQIRDAVIEGFNEFLAAQKATPGDAYFTLATFSSPGTMGCLFNNEKLADVAALHRDTYNPDGWSTALYDAMHEFIEGTQVDAAAFELQHGVKPRVLVITMTDGLNNDGATQQSAVFDEIKRRTDDDEWQFVYLGANQDAYAASAKMGVAGGSTRGYAGTHGGTIKAFQTLSSSTAGYRVSGQSATTDFFEEDVEVEVDGEDSGS